LEFCRFCAADRSDTAKALANSRIANRAKTPSTVILMFMMSVAEQAATLDTIQKFIFSFVFRAATRLRFDLKEK
jgi:hypothetical protein